MMCTDYSMLLGGQANAVGTISTLRCHGGVRTDPEQLPARAEAWTRRRSRRTDAAWPSIAS